MSYIAEHEYAVSLTHLIDVSFHVVRFLKSRKSFL